MTTDTTTPSTVTESTPEFPAYLRPMNAVLWVALAENVGLIPTLRYHPDGRASLTITIEDGGEATMFDALTAWSNDADNRDAIVTYLKTRTNEGREHVRMHDALFEARDWAAVIEMALTDLEDGPERRGLELATGKLVGTLLEGLDRAA